MSLWVPLAFGAAAGAVGAVVAAAVAGRLSPAVDFFVFLGRGHAEGIISLALIGALSGALLGCLASHSRRMRARVLFFALLMPALWVFIHAFLLGYLAPSIAALPLGPFLAASVVYGLFLAMARPRFRRFPDVATASGEEDIPFMLRGRVTR